MRTEGQNPDVEIEARIELRMDAPQELSLEILATLPPAVVALLRWQAERRFTS